MKYSSYPAIPAVVAADSILVHQQSSNAEKLITAAGLADSISGMETEQVVSTLKAVDVSSLSTGAHRVLSGYYVAGDGGGGPVYYSATSTLPDNGGTVIAPNVGAGRWLRPSTQILNVRQFGAKGDGVANDTNPIQSAIDVVKAAGNGTVYLPAGTYLITTDLTLANTPSCNISIIGDGPNVSIIYQSNAVSNGLNLNFLNVGILQSFRVTIENLGLTTAGTTGTAIIVSYGQPAVTSSHNNATVLIDNVQIRSDGGAGYWSNGIDITSAWCSFISNTTISGGAFGGNWTSLIGNGIKLSRYCVNSQISNVQCNFWLNGFHYDAGGTGVGDGNTEGLFFSNFTCTAVRRGIQILGNGNATFPRMSTFVWSGGMVDARACIACVDLQHVEDVMISDVMLVHGNPSGANYGVRLDTCGDVSIRGAEFFALDNGVVTLNTCFGVVVSECVFRGVLTQVSFSSGTTGSASRGAVNVGANPSEINLGGPTNKMYQGQNLGASVYLANDQATTDSTDHTMSWEGNRFNSSMGSTIIWDPGQPARLNIPAGVSFVRVSAGTRWAAGAGGRKVRIRSHLVPDNLIWAGDDKTVGVDLGDSAISTGIIPTTGISYLDVVVTQTSGGPLNVRAVEGTYFQLEIIS